MQTISGAQNTRETMIRKCGSYEAYRQRMREMGRKGGLRKDNPGGFGAKTVGKDGMTGKQRAMICGSKGGRISRRRPNSAV